MSGMASEDDVKNAISLGCAGYFPKTLACDLLLKGLDLVIKGEKYIPVDADTGRILSSKKSENWMSNSYGGVLSETANDIHDRWVQFRESSLQEKHRVIDEQREHEDVKFTKREKDVLSYLVKGERNKDIADALGVKTVTIKLHVRSICRKFGVKNRTQAALRAREVNI
ncbi:MAG: response regulator transcription factor [Alphaproteobacteria bacterium]|nr:response regulator transcription factor [Alphaproteobacteria bacterium]